MLINTGNWIALLGISGGIIAFITGFIQYIKAQRWKRAEFVAKEIKEFESKQAIKVAFQMLDWNVREYELYTKEKKSTEQKILIDDDKLISALVLHIDKKSYFTDEEIFIRDIFDQLLDAFERFEHFIQSGLVSQEDFRPYLIYWIEIMGDMDCRRKPKQFYESLWSYIDFYGYYGVQKFFSRYSYDIYLHKITEH